MKFDQPLTHQTDIDPIKSAEAEATIKQDLPNINTGKAQDKEALKEVSGTCMCNNSKCQKKQEDVIKIASSVDFKLIL